MKVLSADQNNIFKITHGNDKNPLCSVLPEAKVWFVFSFLRVVCPIVYKVFVIYDVQATFSCLSKLQNTDLKTLFLKVAFIPSSGISDVRLFCLAAGDKLE